MASRPAEAAPADAGTTRFHLVVAVWGETYCRLFLEVGLPSLLAPGNLPALGADAEPRFEIHTRAEDMPQFEAAASYARLRALMPVDLVTVERTDDAPHTLMSACHRQGLRNACARGAAVVFVPPDCVWADGSFANLARIAARKPSVVHMSGLRLDRDAVAPRLRRRWLSPEGDVLAVAPRDLVRIAMDHLHPITDDLFFREKSDALMPANLLWPVPGQGILARCFHLHPLLARPDERGAGFTTTIDDDLALMLDPAGAHDYIVADSDEILAFELSGLDHRVQAAFAKGSVEDVAAWAEVAANARHRQLVRTPIRIHWTDVDPAVWRAVEKEAEDVVNRVAALNARSGLSLMWHHGKILQYRAYAATLRAPPRPPRRPADRRRGSTAPPKANRSSRDVMRTTITRLRTLRGDVAGLPTRIRRLRFRVYEAAHGWRSHAMFALRTAPARLRRRRFLAYEDLHGVVTRARSFVVTTPTRLRQMRFRAYQSLHGAYLRVVFEMRTFPARLRVARFLVYQRIHGCVHRLRYESARLPTQMRQRVAYWNSLISGGVRYHGFTAYERCHHAFVVARFQLASSPARWRVARFRIYERLHHWRTLAAFHLHAMPGRLRYHGFLVYQRAHHVYVTARWRVVSAPFHLRVAGNRLLATILRGFVWIFGAPPHVRPWHWRSPYERQVVQPLIDQIAARPGRVLLVETEDMPIGASVDARRRAAGLPEIALWRDSELPERIGGRFDTVVIRRAAAGGDEWPLLPRLAGLVRPGGTLMVSLADGDPAASDGIAAQLGGNFALTELQGRGGPGTALLVRLYRRVRTSRMFGHAVSPWLELLVRAAAAPLFLLLSPAASAAAHLLNRLGTEGGAPVETVLVLRRAMTGEARARPDGRKRQPRDAARRVRAGATPLQRRRSG